MGESKTVWEILHGLPHWAISIALEHKGQIVAGVVFDAAKDEMFFAEKGAGALPRMRPISSASAGPMSAEAR